MSLFDAVSIIVPSLSPDEKFLSLLQDLREAGFEHVVVVNDGSSSDYAPYFEKAEQQYGCTVLVHAVNQGKGRALKTAFHHLLAHCPSCQVAVTVDSDGQHRIHDIQRVAEEMLRYPRSLTFGCRDFSAANDNIPARSRFGNVTTSRVLRLLCGIRLSDTQTGLRGFSPETMRLFLSTKGERFEYEMNMILDAKEHGIELREIPIDTVYIEENRTSHFNPLKDSLRIYAVFSKFILSSMSSFAVDILLFHVFTILLGSIGDAVAAFIATYAARAISALFKYPVNKKAVFKNHGKTTSTLLRYIIVCLVQVTTSAFAVSSLVHLLDWNATLLKLLVDLVLFLISFNIQRSWVFREK